MPDEKAAAWITSSLNRLRNLPGVTQAEMTTALPEGQDSQQSVRDGPVPETLTDEYFDNTLGLRAPARGHKGIYLGIIQPERVPYPEGIKIIETRNIFEENHIVVMPSYPRP